MRRLRTLNVTVRQPDPGVVLVSITSGSLVRYDEHCSATVYATGSAFVESGDHAGLVRNESTTTAAIVHVTYVVPAGTANSTCESTNRFRVCAGGRRWQATPRT